MHRIVAVNVNWNDDEWNLNANDFDNVNPWNEGNVFLYPDTAYLLPNYIREVLFCETSFDSTLFFQPPSILPTSCSF